MAEPLDFDRRLGDALDRYAERAPVAPDPAAVASAAMGPAGSARRWPVPRLADWRLVLLLGLLLLAAFALVAGPGSQLIRRDPFGVAVPSPSPTLRPVASVVPTGPEIGEGEAWYAYMATDGSARIEAVRSDGTGRHPLFPLVPGGEQLHPDWSPAGDRLVFTVRSGETTDLWVGDADGAGTTRLIDCVAPCQWVAEPAWSPDAGSIAFHRMVDVAGTGRSTLEILDLRTDRPRTVFTAPAGQAVSAPRWSGDGTSLVFELLTMAGPAFDAEVTGVALAILDLDRPGSAPRAITTAADRCNNPDWSWVTDLIVCSKPAAAVGFDGPSDLYVVQPDGTGFAALTDRAATGGEATKPTWLPDGSAVVFCDSDGIIWTVGADGTEVTLAIGGNAPNGLHARLRPTP